MINVNIDVDSGVASPSEEDHQEASGLEKVRGGLTKSRTQSGEDAGIGSEQGKSTSTPLSRHLPLTSPRVTNSLLSVCPRMLELQISPKADAVLK